MNSKIRLYNSLAAFSEQFNITPQLTKDIGEWWRNALYEMDKEDFYFLYEILKPFPQFPQLMREDLERRKLELDQI
ncbi:hypothetical protein [Metabacillus fastidiosus]|uniref:hypothetical protein n=1 Tax=Metabacillus fastidiosus TaxID=1458 RepID=UPI003D2CF46A